MSKVSNTITMVKLLQSGRKYSIRELSDILEVSQRMIRIYKDDLEKAGIYIETIMGPYGGYVLTEPIKLPTIIFNDEDVNTLQRCISKENNDEYKKKLIVLHDKIKGEYIANQTKPSKLTDDNLRKFNLLTKAIKEKKKVKILYYSYGKGNNVRVIDPAEMFLFNDGWYCAAYCELKKDIRHFELNRIKEYELLEEKYK